MRINKTNGVIQPLCLRAQEGHDKTVEFLLKQDNINVHHENIHGETALIYGSQMWQYSAF
jgi:hypothetical protein